MGLQFPTFLSNQFEVHLFRKCSWVVFLLYILALTIMISISKAYIFWNNGNNQMSISLELYYPSCEIKSKLHPIYFLIVLTLKLKNYSRNKRRKRCLHGRIALCQHRSMSATSFKVDIWLWWIEDSHSNSFAVSETNHSYFSPIGDVFSFSRYLVDNNVGSKCSNEHFLWSPSNFYFFFPAASYRSYPSRVLAQLWDQL